LGSILNGLESITGICGRAYIQQIIFYPKNKPYQCDLEKLTHLHSGKLARSESFGGNFQFVVSKSFSGDGNYRESQQVSRFTYNKE